MGVAEQRCFATAIGRVNGVGVSAMGSRKLSGMDGDQNANHRDVKFDSNSCFIDEFNVRKRNERSGNECLWEI